MSLKWGVYPRHERDLVASPDWAIGFGSAVEEVGCESVWVGEYVVVAENYESRYPYSKSGRSRLDGTNRAKPDPLEWLSFLAAVTSSVRMATGVIVLPLHIPLALAKRVSTLDTLSKGRVILGVGAGWMIEQFESIDVPYGGRGERLEEYIEALRVLWREEYASLDGRFTSFHRVASEPKPVRGNVPIVIGGSSAVAARRAGRIGDGFFPFAISPQDLAERIGQVEAAALAAGRSPETIEITAWPASWARGQSLDVDVARRFVDLGVTRVVVSVADAATPDMDDVRRFLGDFREHVFDRL